MERDSSALIILPTRRQVHQVFRRVALLKLKSTVEKTQTFFYLFLTQETKLIFFFIFVKIAFDSLDRVHFLQDYHQHEIPHDKEGEAKQTGNESKIK